MFCCQDTTVRIGLFNQISNVEIFIFSLGPSEINYRANIWALKEAGVTCILASNASGSLIQEIAPGDIVICDSFIDRTTKRIQTFYGNEEGHLKGVCHIPAHPAYSEALRQVF